MRMDIAVREKTDKVQGVILCVRYGLLPGIAFENLAGFYRVGYQLCALGENLTGAERVVADLRIAHIVVGGEPDGCSVGFKAEAVVFLHEHIERGRVSRLYGVALDTVAKTDAVHNNSEHGAFFAPENSFGHGFYTFLSVHA